MSDSHWFAWKTLHPVEAEDPASVWAAAHRAGWYQCLKDTSEFSELVPKLSELLMHFRDMKAERDIEHDALFVERLEQ